MHLINKKENKMSDAHETQKRMQSIQENDAVLDAFSKLVSGGRYGYKSVIEKKHEKKR